MQLIVLGMHRSGTSAITRLLNMAGAYFGPEGIATPAKPENPKGFWERQDVRQLCDGLLQDSGFDWWRIGSFDVDAIPRDVRERHLGPFRDVLLGLDAHRPWVVKEPRLCLLLPLLRPMLEVPICLHVTREPLEVAESIAERNGFPLHVGISLWEVYTLRGLQASTGLPRCHLRYEDLLRDPVGTLEGVLDWLETEDVQGLHRPSAAEITAFVDPELHRQEREAGDRRGMLDGQQLELADATDAGALLVEQWEQRQPSESALAVLRDYEQRVDDASKAAAALEAARASIRTGIQAAERERERVRAAESANAEIERILDDGLGEAEKQLQAIQRSRAWRLARRVASLRQRVVPGVARDGRDRIEPVVRALTDTRRALESSARKANTTDAHPSRPDESVAVDRLRGGVTLRHAGATRAARPDRPKVAVIAWDVGHNPLGRAYCLAETLSRHFDVAIWARSSTVTGAASGRRYGVPSSRSTTSTVGRSRSTSTRWRRWPSGSTPT